MLLAVQHVLFTIANLPALYIAFFGVGRLLSYYFDPFGILSQYVNFACAIPLNCDAKVQRYLLSTKQKTKKVCIFNVLQQIRLFLPKFIHILSTKTGKCAIYKAKMFAFRLISHVHYIITNNNATFVACLRVFVFVFVVCCRRINAMCSTRTPPPQN